MKNIFSEKMKLVLFAAFVVCLGYATVKHYEMRAKEIQLRQSIVAKRDRNFKYFLALMGVFALTAIIGGSAAFIPIIVGGLAGP